MKWSEPFVTEPKRASMNLAVHARAMKAHQSKDHLFKINRHPKIVRSTLFANWKAVARGSERLMPAVARPKRLG
jgi:hypothetical protein